MRNRLLITCAAVLCLLGNPVLAWNPAEQLKEPILEKRARALSANLRCLVCQNQSIDDSDADLARDLRILVRERIAAGDSDDQVIEFLVSRYGEFVLLKPRFSASTFLLWGLPILALAGGATAVFMSSKKRRKRVLSEEMSDEEKARLASILSQH